MPRVKNGVTTKQRHKKVLMLIEIENKIKETLENYGLQESMLHVV